LTTVRQKILAAYLTRNEILALVPTLNTISDPAAKAKFWADYATARSKFGSIQAPPITSPQLLPLPQEANDHIHQVETTDSFQENFGGLTYKFHMVPIDRLVPVQIFCNLEPEIPPPDSSDLADLLNYALPPNPLIPSEAIITPNGFRFTSPRYGMGPQNVRRRIHDGKVILSFEHLNLVQVRRFGDTLVLANGIHRAFEMARAKRTHVPAIVIEHKDLNEYQWPGGPGFWNSQFLTATQRQPAQGARPPLIGDFLTDLAVECSVTVVPSLVEMNISAPANPTTAPPQPIALQIGGLVPQPQQ
jgi:hypothetical protein